MSVAKDLVDSDIFQFCRVCCCSLLATNTAEIIVNTVFGLIGFYEDSRTWTNVNPIGRFMTA